MKLHTTWIVILLLALMLTGCNKNRKPSYNWKLYEKAQEAVLVHKNEQAYPPLLNKLKKEHEKYRLHNIKVPAGYNALIGYIHDRIGRVDESKQYFLEEKKLYPECAHFVDYLLEDKNNQNNKKQTKLAKTILILPPRNKTADVEAEALLLSKITKPFVQQGFYVLPIPAVKHFFDVNGVSMAKDIHEIPKDKLKEVFGADAALYIHIEDWNTRYYGIGNQTSVEIQFQLQNLETGKTLWKRHMTKSVSDNININNDIRGELLGVLFNNFRKNVSNEELKLAIKINNEIARDVKAKYRSEKS